MSLEALCSTHMIDVGKSFTTQDASYGSKRTFVPYLTGVACNIQPASLRERILFAQRQVLFTNRIYFSADPNITRDCLITVTSSPTPEQIGATYVPTGQADMAGQGRAFVLNVNEQSRP